MNWKTSGITVLFGLLLCGLMSLHISDPWQFSNDDNGAWFSAIARTHQHAGLRATRGQDFFTSRETSELVPYLHHPPLPGLILAMAFTLTGSTSPATARLTFAFLHLVSFVGIACLAHQIWKPSEKPLPYFYALAVAATVPMSSFYGKMPNHEAPGLLFFTLGVLAWGFPDGPKSVRRVILALVTWFLAIFASWHAFICIVLWLLVNWDHKHPLRVTLSLFSVILPFGLVCLHLFWANGMQSIPSQEQSLTHWTLGGGGASLLDCVGFLQHAIGIGIGRYAYLPACLAIAWIVMAIVDRVRTRHPTAPQARGLIGLCLGSVVYAVLFPRAVSNHAYQGFYLIPFVALASSVTLQRLCGQPRGESRHKCTTICGFTVLILTCVLGILLSFKMYKKHSPGAVKAAHDIERQYL